MTTKLDLTQFEGHTPGPWFWLGDQGQFIVAGEPDGAIVAEVPCQGCNDLDGPIIAAAPALLALVRERQEQIKVLRQALESLKDAACITLRSEKPVRFGEDLMAHVKAARAALDATGE